MSDNQNNSNKDPKKAGAVVQILIGLGISLAAYFLTFGLSSIFNTMGITAIIAFVILALFGFLIVKFFRTGYKAAAITMLIFISPLIILLLLLGACALTTLPL
jgi:type IV secretory pathway VirB6-like protein